MPRPRKNQPKPDDKRADANLSLFHQHEIDRARVDPFNDEPLAGVLAGVLLDRATESERAFVGNLLVNALAKCSPAQLAGFFDRVVKLKLNTEQPHRNAFAYWGYVRHIEETGREPSKPELKAYLLENPKVFPGMPAAEDKRAWTRLWADCGLGELANR